MTDNLARHNALIELERSHDGPIPSWEREAGIRGARTERENLEHDLGIARHSLQARSDTLRAWAHEVMLRHRAAMKARKANSATWREALGLYGRGRLDLQFYLDAFKAQRGLVRELEKRLAALESRGPINVSIEP